MSMSYEDKRAVKLIRNENRWAAKSPDSNTINYAVMWDTTVAETTSTT